MKMYLNIGTPNNYHFPFGTNGKVVVLGVPILKHSRYFLPNTDFNSINKYVYVYIHSGKDLNCSCRT